MFRLLWIAAGGAVGALLRYLVDAIAYHAIGTGFPWGTLIVNLTGCLLIGIAWALVGRMATPHVFVPFLVTGILGAFTTFSTYSLESINLLRHGDVGLALLNVIGSNVLGLVLAYLGFVYGTYLLKAGAG